MHWWGLSRWETFCSLAAGRQPVAKPSFCKSQETAPNACQQVSKPHLKKLAKSRLQFLSASFYVPDTTVIATVLLPPTATATATATTTTATLT